MWGGATPQCMSLLIILPGSGRPDVTLETNQAGAAVCVEDSEEGGREKAGDKKYYHSFCSPVASFPSDTEVEQDEGGVSVSEQTWLKKKERERERSGKELTPGVTGPG